MSDAVNVMMIGFPASGKTSYMASLYHRFSAETVAGFNIQCCSSHNHNILSRLGKNIQKGIYPDSTDFMSKYSFHLQYNGETILPFNWSDYRGSSLISSYEVAKDVLDEINQADAMIIFLDSTSFIGKESRSIVKTVKRVYQLMQFAVQNKSEERNFPISLVITKADAVDFSQLAQSEAMKIITTQIIPTIAQSKSVCGLFTFTVVGPTCAYIEYPFIFSMWWCLKNRCVECAQLAQQYLDEYHKCVKEAEEHADNMGIIDSGFSLLFGVPSERELAEQKAQSAKEKYGQVCNMVTEMKKIEAPIDLLAQIMKDSNDDEDCLVALF